MTDDATRSRVLTGDCETDCVDGCAYPGRFSECSLGGAPDATPDRAATPDGLAIDLVNTLVDAMVDDPKVVVRVPDASMRDLYWVAHRMLGARLD